MACPKCFDLGDKQSGDVKGKLTTYAGYDAYITGAENKDVAIIYNTDVWGCRLLNHQLNADQFSDKFFVVIPEILNDAMDSTDPNALAGIKDWLKRNSLDHATEVAKKVVDQLRKDGFKKVIGLGFCYGARMVINLANAKLIDQGAVFHASFLSVDDISGLKASGVPILFNCAENDGAFTTEMRLAYEAEVKGQCEFIVYPNQDHGFAARPKGEEAHKQREAAIANTYKYLTQ